MKTLKLISLAAMAFVLCLGFAACSSDESLPEEGEYIEVPLSVSFDTDIDISDLPLSKGVSPKPYYAIMVYEKNPNTTKYEFHAQGTFSDISLAKVKMRTDRLYKIEASVIFDLLEKGYIFDNNKKPNEQISNSIEYDSSTSHLFSGAKPGFLKRQERGPYNIYSLAFVDSYWGILNDYKPSSSCNINLTRATCGLEVKVTGVSTGTFITKLNEDEGVSTDLTVTDTFNKLYTYGDMIDIHHGKVGDSGFLRLQISYKLSDNSVMLYDKSVQVKRGYKKRILINIKEKAPSVEQPSFSVSLEDKPIQDEPQEKVEVTL